MNRPSTITTCLIKKKVVTLMLLTASVAAFAMLGDGGKKGRRAETSILLPYSAKNFSLSSHYNYKSNNFFAVPEKKEFIMLKPVVTYQRGNAAYILPLKKIPLLGKIKFSATPQ